MAIDTRCGLLNLALFFGNDHETCVVTKKATTVILVARRNGGSHTFPSRIHARCKLFSLGFS